jgi:hypothetical protein
MVSVQCFDRDLGSLADIRVEVRDPSGADITPWGHGSTSIPSGDYYVWDALSIDGGTHFVRISNEGGPTGACAYYRCLATSADFSFQ